MNNPIQRKEREEAGEIPITDFFAWRIDDIS